MFKRDALITATAATYHLAVVAFLDGSPTPQRVQADYPSTYAAQFAYGSQPERKQQSSVNKHDDDPDDWPLAAE